MKNTQYIIIGFVFLYFSQMVIAENSYPILKFNKVEDRNLNLDHVKGSYIGVAYDDYGVMWITKSTGIFKYNGQEFIKVITPTLELDFPYTCCATFDKSGDLIFGSTVGFGKYNPRNNSVKHFYRDKSKVASSEYLSSILPLDDDEYLLGFSNSISIFNSATNIETPLFSREELTEKPSSFIYVSALVKANQWIWAGTYQEGLLQFDLNNKALNKHKSIERESGGVYTFKNIREIVTHPLDDKLLYIGDSNGLHLYDIENHLILNKASLTGIKGPIYSLFAEDDKVWVGSNKLFSIDNDGTVVEYSKQLDLGIPSGDYNAIGTIFVDKQGTVHVFINGEGLFKASRFTSKLRKLNGINGNPIVVYKENENRVLVGMNNGLYQLDNKGDYFNVAEVFRNHRAKFGLIRDISDGYKGTIVITENKLIALYEDGHVKNEYDLSSLMSKRARLTQTIQISHNQFITRTFFGNFNIFNTENNSFEELIFDGFDFSNYKRAIFHANENKDKILFLVTGKIGVLDLTNMTSSVIYEDESLISINASKVSKDKYLITSAQSNVFHFDFESETITKQPILDHKNKITRLIPLSQNNMVILNYDKSASYLSDTININPFKLTDGAPYMGLLNDYAVKIGPSEVLMASRSGLYYTHVEKYMKLNHYVKAPSISKILVNGSEYIHTDRNLAIQELKSIILEPGVESLFIYFNGNTTAMTSNEKYFYRTDENENWTAIGNNGELMLTNLQHGSFELDLMMHNHDNVKSPPRRIRVDIKPYFYESQLAYLLYIIAIFSIIYAMFRFNLNIRLNKQKLIDANNQKQIKDNLNVKLNRFIAEFNHEIRTPALVVISNVQSLIRVCDNDPGLNKYKQLLLKTYIASQNLTDLVRNILDYQKESMGQSFDIQKQTFFLFEAVESIHIILETKAIQNCVTIDNRVDKKLEIHSDKQRCIQIITNILSNSVKYSKGTSGLVTVEALVIDNIINIWIKDNGLGMSEDNLSRLFTPYERFHEEHDSGYGIGMSLTKSLIKSLDGRIHVESRLNVGTTVHISLPNETSKNKSINKVIESRLNPVDFSDRIIVFDDDELILSSIRFIFGDNCLTINPFKMSFSELKSTILPVIKTRELVVSDYNFKALDFSARDLFEFIKHENPSVNIVLTSGTDSSSILDKETLTYVDSFLAKPYDIYSAYKDLCQKYFV